MIASIALLSWVQVGQQEVDTAPKSAGFELVQVIAVGDSPRFLSFSEDGSSAFVSLGDSVSYAEIDCQSLEGVPVDESVDFLPPYPMHRVVYDDFPELSFFISSDGSGVRLIDNLNGVNQLTDEPIAKIELPNVVSGTLTPDATDYVVVCGLDDSLAWINTASYEVVSRVHEGVGPGASAIVNCPGDRFALVSNSKGNTVSVLDFESRRIVDQVVVDEGPVAIAIHPTGRQAYVVCEAAGTVCVLSLPEKKLEQPRGTKPNQVFMLGTIHGGHETSERYDLKFLEAFIREVDPDFILAEIPPNRARAAMESFAKDGVVSEPRVMRFPEYLQVVYPLTRELDFQIIPTAGWTEPMARFRSNRLRAIAEDPKRAEEWAEYQAASRKAEECQAAAGEDDDYYFIHTSTYDDCVEIDLAVYDRLFNDELGPGGWTAINQAHYGHIADALDLHSGEGQKFLITYGAGHKGWFLRELRKREDIELVELAPVFKRVEEVLGRN